MMWWAAAALASEDGSNPWSALTEGAEEMLVGSGAAEVSYLWFDRDFLELQAPGFSFHSRTLPFVEGTLAGAVGVSDRVDLLLPAMVAVQLARDPSRGTVVWGGVSDFGSPYEDEGNGDTAWQGAASLGLDHRLTELRVGDLSLGAMATLGDLWSTDPRRFEGWPPRWQGRARFAWSVSVEDRLELHVAVQGIYLEGWRYGLTHSVLLGFGSDELQAGRNLPLVRLHVTDWLAIDGFASAALRVYSHDTGAIGPTRPDDTDPQWLYRGNVGTAVRF